MSAQLSAAAPRFATERTLSRRSYGNAAFKISRVLGQPLMPWQRQVVDVALEVDDAGQFVYRDVVLTVPRQQGKTTLSLSLILHRALVRSRQHIVYCAQSALDARKKWDADWVPVV